MNAYVCSTRGFRNGGGGVSCYDNLYGGGGFSSVAASPSVSWSRFVLFNGVVDGFYGLRQSTLIHWSIGTRMCAGGAGYGYNRLPAATHCACCCFNKGWQDKRLSRKQRRGRWVASLKWEGDGEDCCDSSEDGDDCEMVSLLRNANAKLLIDGRRRGEKARVQDSRIDKSRKMGKGRIREAKVDIEDKCVKDDVVSTTVEKYRNARREGSRHFDSGSSYYSAMSGGDFENSLDLISAADNKRLSRESGAELVVRMEDDTRVKEQKFVGESSRSSKKREVQERTKIRRSEDRVLESASRDDVDTKEILEYQLQQKSQEGFTKNSQRADRVESKEETSSSFVHSKYSGKKQSILENKASSGSEEFKSQRIEEISDLCLSGGQNAAMSKEASTSRIAQDIVTNSSALLSMDNTIQHETKDGVKLESMELARLNAQKHDTCENQTQMVASSRRSTRKEHEKEEESKRQRKSDFNVVSQFDTREESRRLALGSDNRTSPTSNWKGATDEKESIVLSNFFDEESTVKYNQAAKQSDKRLGSRVESQRLASSSHEIERTSSSHRMTRTKWQKQQSTSTEELSEAARTRLNYSKIQRLPQHGSEISGSSSPSKSSSQGHVSSQAGAEITHASNMTHLVQDDLLESASCLDKSSKHLVGEFVNKAKEEISYTHGLIISSKEEKFKRDEHNINVNIQMNLDDLRQSSSSEQGPKGPSDEMWSEVVPSSVAVQPGKGNNSPKAAEEAKTPRDAESSSGKKSSRSLWVFLGDVVRSWSPRSEARKTTAKSNARSSSNESAASETWFSGNEPDGADGDDKSRTERVSGQRGTSSVYSRSQSLPCNSSQNQSLDEKNEAEVDSLTSLGSGGIRIPPNVSSGTAVSDYFLPIPGVVASPVIPIELTGSSSTISMPVSVPSPVLPTQLVGSSFTVKVPEIRDTNDANNDLTDVHVDPIEEKQIEAMGTEVQNTELKRRKLQRNKQVLKERFEEWEEAFIVEHEQRKIDEMFMREALVEAKKAADAWEVPVGAVLVQHGKIIARGCNLVEELRDSTAHAEMICIREASNVLRTWRLAETTLYVTLEPCPMCAGAILQARIDSVVWGAPNKLLGADGSWISLFPSGGEGSGSDRPAGPVHPFHPKMNIRRGVLATECADVMQQFFQLRRKKNKKLDSPPSFLPVSTPTKFISKMHDMFSMMFCL